MEVPSINVIQLEVFQKKKKKKSVIVNLPRTYDLLVRLTPEMMTQ